MIRSVTTACLTMALVGAVPVNGQPRPVPATAPAAPTAQVPPPSAAQVPIALLVDLSSGQTLFARDETRRFMPASITKVMTVLVAFELMDKAMLKPEQQFTVSAFANENWRRVGSTMFLEPDSKPTVDELLMGITTVSANDGCVVLAEGAAGSVERWLDLMNETAREIGMADSHFGSPNGYPDGGQTFVSARDLATLARALILRHPDKYRRYFGHRGLETNGFAQANHDPITGVVEGADGIKTGFTNQAGYGFLGSAERGGRRLVMIVGAVESGSLRQDAARDLMEWGFAAFSSRQLYPAGASVGDARVQDGASATVGLVAPQAIRAAFPVGETAQMTLAIRYDGPLRAPIAKGETVAELAIMVDGLPEARVPLVAAQDVPQAGIFGRLRNGLAGLVP